MPFQKKASLNENLKKLTYLLKRKLCKKPIQNKKYKFKSLKKNKSNILKKKNKKKKNKILKLKTLKKNQVFKNSKYLDLLINKEIFFINTLK